MALISFRAAWESSGRAKREVRKIAKKDEHAAQAMVQGETRGSP